MKKPYVIIGSARPDGQTRRAVDLAFPAGTADIVELAKKIIQQYPCPPSERSDDFFSIVNQMQITDTVVFATPVCWYAMGARLKTLYDRFYDLLGNNLGHSLAGKDVWLIATGADISLPAGFETPFAKTAEYFQMRYREAFYLRTGCDSSFQQQAEISLMRFGEEILRAAEGHVSI